MQVAYYFSIRMMRLILLMGPITSALGGLAIGSLIEWAVCQIFNMMPLDDDDDDEEEEEEDSSEVSKSAPAKKGGRKQVSGSPSKVSEDKDSYTGPDTAEKIKSLRAARAKKNAGLESRPPYQTPTP
jgi:hypothetical protein